MPKRSERPQYVIAVSAIGGPFGGKILGFFDSVEDAEAWAAEHIGKGYSRAEGLRWYTRPFMDVRGYERETRPRRVR